MQPEISILIIDDESDICFLLSKMLKNRSSKILSYTSLKEGIKKIDELNPTLLFLDISLQDGCGLDEVRGIKDRSPELKVIMISAYDSEREAAMLEGADMFIPKPFSKEIVNKAIEVLFPSRITA